jgi:hypothetical protein
MADKRWPQILLYGVIINQAIQSGDKDVMQAVAKVSNFMMGRVDKSDDEMVSDWYKAHDDLLKALG